MEGLFSVGFFFIFLIIGIIGSIISRDNREKKKDAWRQLAVAHQLELISNDDFLGNGAYVIGMYRGHLLRLETMEKKQGKNSVTYTRVGVSVNSRPNNRPKKKDEPRPSLSFQEALQRFTSLAGPYEIKAEPDGQPVYYEQRNVIQNTQFLTYLFDLLTQLAEAYPVIVAQGGEAVRTLHPVLENPASRAIAVQLLRDIARRNSDWLAQHAPSLLCPHCLTRFGPHEVSVSWWNSFTYYGCRSCGQNRNYYEGSVVAVLDNQMADKPVQQEGIIRVNWSTHRELFDFDAVEIVRASDEEVERFAVQVGNDTDETRASRYEVMQCVVHPNCRLSENSLRILERMFGQVITGQEGSWQSKEESRIHSGLLKNELS